MINISFCTKQRSSDSMTVEIYKTYLYMRRQGPGVVSVVELTVVDLLYFFYTGMQLYV